MFIINSSLVRHSVFLCRWVWYPARLISSKGVNVLPSQASLRFLQTELEPEEAGGRVARLGLIPHPIWQLGLPDWAGNLSQSGNPSCSVLQVGLSDWVGKLAQSGNPDWRLHHINCEDRLRASRCHLPLTPRTLRWQTDARSLLTGKQAIKHNYYIDDHLVFSYKLEGQQKTL